MIRHLVFFFMIFMGTTARGAHELSIMTFNVENLFDTLDDPAKDDETFLPIEKKQNKKHQKKCRRIEVPKWREQCLSWDWSESVLNEKMKRLAQVVRAVNGGRGPDILFLQEVENKKVLEQWTRDHLKDLGYQKPILIEGADRRGIDVAILSKLQIDGQPKLHAIPFKNVESKRRQDTRGILQADLLLPGGEALTAFAVHLPAPFHPVEMRVQSLRFLNQLMSSLPATRLVVAAGDFNIPRSELATNKEVREQLNQWMVAHELACADCKGTTFYEKDGTWSFLDMILFSKNWQKSDRWTWLEKSFQIVNSAPHQASEAGHPASFAPPWSGPGVSDHFPLEVRIAPRSP